MFLLGPKNFKQLSPWERVTGWYSTWILRKFNMAAKGLLWSGYFFFLWEITQKFFLLALSIHILTTCKNIFCHLEGPNGFLAAFWLVLEQKKGYFGMNFSINRSFVAFQDLLLPSRTFKHSRFSKKKMLRKIYKECYGDCFKAIFRCLRPLVFIL